VVDSNFITSGRKKLTLPARATDRFNIDIFLTFFSLIGSTNMV